MENRFLPLLQKQKKYFNSGATRSYAFRKEQLKKFKALITENEKQYFEALFADLGKLAHESYGTEIGPVLSELRFITNHLREWMAPKKVEGTWFSFPSSGVVMPEPLGTALIISPWNYPFWLSLNPMIAAIAAGNTVILKPSELSTNTSALLKSTFNKYFDTDLIEVVEGGPEVSTQLLDLPPDYIFFTGSTGVGKIVAQAAAKNLVRVTLELGGKSPSIVDESANLAVAARRLMWGKCINSGQTCVGPDYLLVHKNVKAKFIEEIKKTLEKSFSNGALNDSGYPHIINEKNYERVKSMMDKGEILLGGKTDDQRMMIEPTLIGNITFDDRIMKEEIFGPLLPVLEFETADDVINMINKNANPLSLYLFSSNKKFQNRILNEVSFGGAMVNDTIEHLGNPHLPFGGVGASGLGAYHGKYSFDAFTHYKSVLKKSTFIDLPFKYRPFNKLKWKIMRTVLR